MDRIWENIGVLLRLWVSINIFIKKIIDYYNLGYVIKFIFMNIVLFIE